MGRAPPYDERVVLFGLWCVLLVVVFCLILRPGDGASGSCYKIVVVMKKHKNDKRAAGVVVGGGAFRWFENLLFVVCLVVMALRCTFIETPLIDSKNPSLPMTMEGMSLILSAVLAGAFVSWLVVSVVRGKIVWRSSMMVWGVIAFAVIAAVSVLAASDKRAAMTQFSTLIPPMLGAVMFVQILDWTKVKIAMVLLMALAAAATYQCHEQSSMNKETIREYESNPQKHLEPLGKKQGTLQHFQYEHRIYSQDIRGFLLTSNSTSTFLLMAGFAMAGLLVSVARKPMG